MSFDFFSFFQEVFYLRDRNYAITKVQRVAFAKQDFYVCFHELMKNKEKRSIQHTDTHTPETIVFLPILSFSVCPCMRWPFFFLGHYFRFQNYLLRTAKRNEKQKWSWIYWMRSIVCVYVRPFDTHLIQYIIHRVCSNFVAHTHTH